MPFAKLSSNKRTLDQRNRARIRRKEARIQSLQKRKNLLRASSFTYVAYADGDLSPAEIRFANSRGVDLYGSDHRQPRCANVDIRPLRGIPTAAFNITARRTLLRELRDLCLCDGPLNAAEEAALAHIADVLQIGKTKAKGPDEARSAHWNYQRSRTKKAQTTRDAAVEPDPRIPWCYEFLGCHPTDSDQTIKATYRRLAVRYHPDKHSAGAASPETIRVHVERFQKLQSAYQEIQNLRRKTTPDQNSGRC